MAERIRRCAGLVGKENVIAGTDCDFGPSPATMPSMRGSTWGEAAGAGRGRALGERGVVRGGTVVLIYLLAAALLVAVAAPRPGAAQDRSEAESLALRAGLFDRTTLRADPETARAIAGLLARIRQAHPDVATIRGDFPPNTQLLITLAASTPSCPPGPPGAVAALAGRFGGHVRDGGFRAMSIVIATFSDRLHVPSLIAQFRALPCVQSVSENEEIGLGSQSIVAVDRKGDKWRVAIGRGTEDCMAGCIDWQIAFFVVGADGMITRVADWRRGAMGETGQQPWPVWPRRHW